jgi:hypothetical protein
LSPKSCSVASEVLFLDFVADESASDSTEHHGHIATGAATDQAADPEAGHTADNRTNPHMVIARQLHQGDLFDHPAADFHLLRLHPGCSTGGQEQGEGES